jgi:tetratricopeptide (TPR) repeat protein
MRLFEEILDEVEQLATRVPTATLARLLERRAAALPAGAPGRAAWFSHAGERYEMAGDLDAARSCYERAVDDGGGAFVDPRADLANVLLDLGETEAAERLVEDLRVEAKNSDVGEFLHERVGEILELHDRPEEALRWFDAGLVHAQRDEPGAVDLGCLNGHFRVRRVLGLPYDRHDRLCEQHRHDYAADPEDEQRLLEVTGQSSSPTVHTVLYWPEAEFTPVLARWPQVAETCGTRHVEHRERVEQRLRNLTADGARAAVAAGRLSEYVRFARDRGGDPAEASTRGLYAAHLAYLKQVVMWPPDGDAPCWCGSARPYAECCGALPSTT